MQAEDTVLVNVRRLGELEDVKGRMFHLGPWEGSVLKWPTDCGPYMGVVEDDTFRLVAKMVQP
jgi:hypothetical protein